MMLDEMEREWKGPIEGAGASQPWEPVKGLVPYQDAWVPVVEGPDMRQEERPPELSTECLEALSALWDGSQPLQPPAGERQGCGYPEHFHCYPISMRGRGVAVWDKWRQQNGGEAIWWCASLQEAGLRYAWPGHRAGTFVQLGAALQRAMQLQNEVLTNVVCRKILDWGGVRNRRYAARVDWLDSQTRQGTLISSIKLATRALRASSTAALGPLFSGEGCIPMTSGTTKIFAAAALDFSVSWDAPSQDVLIFDGRVTGALGLLERQINHGRPTLFRFPASRLDNRRRDPSCAHITVPNLATLSNVERARFARLGAYCIERVVGKSNFLIAEKALFMVGYNVRYRCDGLPRLCP